MRHEGGCRMKNNRHPHHVAIVSISLNGDEGPRDVWISFVESIEPGGWGKFWAHCKHLEEAIAKKIGAAKVVFADPKAPVTMPRGKGIVRGEWDFREELRRRVKARYGVDPFSSSS